MQGLVEGPTGSSEALWLSGQSRSQYVIPSAPDLQLGEAKKLCFQFGEGEGGNELENAIRGHAPLALPPCAPGQIPDPFWAQFL